MARTAVLGRLSWRVAEVVDLVAETPRATTVVFDVPGWPGHRAGQHVDVRLTAEDGYQAQRSYSISSAPDGSSRIALTVVRIEGGEVGQYLAGELQRGHQIELRGPIGGYFVWEPECGGPVMLVAGGSGLAPLMAMMRLHARARSQADMRLLTASCDWEDTLFREELRRLVGHGRVVVHTLTQSQPPGWTGHARRVDAQMLAELGPDPAEQPQVYVCGPTPFVESVAEALVRLGHQPHAIRTERFGRTGE